METLLPPPGNCQVPAQVANRSHLASILELHLPQGAALLSQPQGLRSRRGQDLPAGALGAGYLECVESCPAWGRVAGVSVSKATAASRGLEVARRMDLGSGRSQLWLSRPLEAALETAQGDSVQPVPGRKLRPCWESANSGPRAGTIPPCPAAPLFCVISSFA